MKKGKEKEIKDIQTRNEGGVSVYGGFDCTYEIPWWHHQKALSWVKLQNAKSAA